MVRAPSFIASKAGLYPIFEAEPISTHHDPDCTYPLANMAGKHHHCFERKHDRFSMAG